MKISYKFLTVFFVPIYLHFLLTYAPIQIDYLKTEQRWNKNIDRLKKESLRYYNRKQDDNILNPLFSFTFGTFVYMSIKKICVKKKVLFCIL